MTTRYTSLVQWYNPSRIQQVYSFRSVMLAHDAENYFLPHVVSVADFITADLHAHYHAIIRWEPLP